MSRRMKLSFASFCLCCLAALGYALNKGILVGSKIEMESRRDFQANKIINTARSSCRYLYPSGVMQFRTPGDAHEQPPCKFFGSN